MDAKRTLHALQFIVAVVTVIWLFWQSSRGQVSVSGIYYLLQISFISAFILMALEFALRAIGPSKQTKT